jgi:hypothetical protein
VREQVQTKGGREQDAKRSRGRRGPGAPKLRLLRLLLIILLLLLQPVLRAVLLLVLLPLPLALALALAALAAAAPAVADGGGVVARDEVLLHDPLPRLHAGKLDVVAPVLCGPASPAPV